MGCKDLRMGYCVNRDEGYRCNSEDECIDCTFGRCVQLAKEKDAEGFSYFQQISYSPSPPTCKLCTIEQLDDWVSLKDDDYWVTYRRSSKENGLWQ